METNTITMSNKELTRYRIITQLIDSKITAPIAAEKIGISVRQVRRLKKKVFKEGAAGLHHGNKGRPSNRTTDKDIKSELIRLIKDKYEDFGPTFAAEKLRENHNINLSKETIRTFMSEESIWKPKKRRGAVEYRRKRKRKEHYGQMQQFDGSYHDWFEGRSPTKKQCLLVAIDDATGKLTKVEIAKHGGEGIDDVFPFWISYLKEYGAPKSVYIDRFSTYKINNPTVADLNVKTNFERAMSELSIETITAHSPQAKGRVERVNMTLQDRLIKELRLANICDIDSANVFIKDIFIPDFNRRFEVHAEKKGDVHRELTENEVEQLPHIFSTKFSRKVGNDFSVMYDTKIYQLAKEQTVTVCKKDTVTVEKHVDGSIHIKHTKRDRYLNFIEIPCRPKKASVVAIPATGRTKKKHIPSSKHPWRQSKTFPKRRIMQDVTH